ncbi:hypothetical protein TUM4438_41810 [Shewanella sairae]|uniref:DUF4440 domain-containing protein n=1 Tax=Shewanella sairae TaxID=190310 RepID=A0ABQ4PQQ9_9GAMM|nr:hypothetical protein [Shewanella sairae]MCL1130387.1 hypothetical protein [Shewanella sairae]GIU51596.1 hypothetical protein TUM4438_41810 [Shewanella sairae]
MEFNKMELIPKLIAATSIMLISLSASALERYAGLNDGSDENLKAVCKDYMVNSYLKNDPELFFHLLPKSMKKMESMLELDWTEGHLKRFGAEPLTEYDFFEMKDNIKHSEYKGLKTKSIEIWYQAGVMLHKRGSSCYFKRHEDGRWYFGKKP